MGEIPMMEMRDGRIGGKIVEKVFFGNAARQLNRIVGVDDLRELEGKDEIVLPDEITKYAKSKMAETERDGNERYAEIFMDKGSVRFQNEKKGEKSFFDEIRNDNQTVAVSAVKYSGMEALGKRYFGKPIPILFHTHPAFPDDFRPNVFSLHDEETTGASDFLQRASSFEFSTFSGPDLRSCFGNNRYINSMLLQTKERTLLIVPKGVSLRIPPSDLDFTFIRYSGKLEAISSAYQCSLMGITPDELAGPENPSHREQSIRKLTQTVYDRCRTEEDFKAVRDRLLAEACKTQGMIVYSGTRENGVLRKIPVSLATPLPDDFFRFDKPIHREPGITDQAGDRK